MAKIKITKQKQNIKVDVELKKFVKKHLNLNYFNIVKEFPILFSIQAKYGHKRVNNLVPKSILIINTSLIGDFLHSLPAMNYFIKYHNECNIDLLVAPQLLSLSKNIKGINSVAAMKTIFQKAKNEVLPLDVLSNEYDLILIMRIPKNIKHLLKAIEFKEIRTYLGVYLKLGLSLLEKQSSKKVVKQMREINFEVIGDKDFHENQLNVDDTFSFKKTEIEKIKGLEIFTELENTKKVLIHTGSGWEIKFWSAEKWISLLTEMSKLDKYSFVFVGANKQEEDYFNEIQQGLNFPVYSVINKMDIKDSLLFMKNCQYFIGVDSGPRHIAHLLNIPSISLLGRGPQSFAPLNDKGLVIDKGGRCMCTNLACFMLTTCLELITVDEVLELVKNNWLS